MPSRPVGRVMVRDLAQVPAIVLAPVLDLARVPGTIMAGPDRATMSGWPSVLRFWAAS